MMPSCHGNLFHISGPLWKETTGPVWWIRIMKGLKYGALIYVFCMLLACANCWTNTIHQSQNRTFGQTLTQERHFIAWPHGRAVGCLSGFSLNKLIGRCGEYMIYLYRKFNTNQPLYNHFQTNDLFMGEWLNRWMCIYRIHDFLILFWF